MPKPLRKVLCNICGELGESCLANDVWSRHHWLAVRDEEADVSAGSETGCLKYQWQINTDTWNITRYHIKALPVKKMTMNTAWWREFSFSCFCYVSWLLDEMVHVDRYWVMIIWNFQIIIKPSCSGNKWRGYIWLAWTARNWLLMSKLPIWTIAFSDLSSCSSRIRIEVWWWGMNVCTGGRCRGVRGCWDELGARWCWVLKRIFLRQGS